MIKLLSAVMIALINGKTASPKGERETLLVVLSNNLAPNSSSTSETPFERVD